MNQAFTKIDTEEEFVALLKKYNLFREDDVTFDELDDGNNYVYTGDDFLINAGILDELDLGALLIIGNVQIDDLSIGDVLPDFGVFCVTGDLGCKDLFYCTESTGVSIGGNLTVEQLFYADCGNSVLQVNGNLNAKVVFISQCSVEVGGEEKSEFNNKITMADLRTMGLTVEGHSDPEKVIRGYFANKRS